jgi:NRPS condensation-like uncharacterized protein
LKISRCIVRNIDKLALMHFTGFIVFLALLILGLMFLQPTYDPAKSEQDNKSTKDLSLFYTLSLFGGPTIAFFTISILTVLIEE